MAQINLKSPNQPVADFSVTDTLVAVAGVFIDCSERQQDIDVMVEIRDNVGGPSEGGSGAYLAQVLIPARRYVEEIVDDAKGEGTVLRTPLPLDPNAIEITLWPRATAVSTDLI